MKIHKIRVPGAKGKEAKKIQADFEIKVGEWAAVLADDYDSDWGSVLTMLRFKLSRMSKHMTDHKFFEGYEEIAAEVDVAVGMLDKLMADEYEDKHLEAYYSEYGTPTMVLSGRADGMSTAQSIYPNGKPATKAMNRQLIKALHAAAREKQRDMMAAFVYIAKNLMKWWC